MSSSALSISSAITDARIVLEECVGVLRELMHDVGVRPETRRRAAATLIAYLLPRPSSRTRATDSAAVAADKSVSSSLSRDSVPGANLQRGQDEGSGASVPLSPISAFIPAAKRGADLLDAESEPFEGEGSDVSSATAHGFFQQPPEPGTNPGGTPEPDPIELGLAPPFTTHSPASRLTAAAVAPRGLDTS